MKKSSTDSTGATSLSEADLEAIGIDVNLEETSVTINSQDSNLLDTTVDVVIRMYITEDETFQVFTTISVNFSVPECQMTYEAVLNRLGDAEMKISLTAQQATSEDESEYE